MRFVDHITPEMRITFAEALGDVVGRVRRVPGGDGQPSSSDAMVREALSKLCEEKMHIDSEKRQINRSTNRARQHEERQWITCRYQVMQFKHEFLRQSGCF